MFKRNQEESNYRKDLSVPFSDTRLCQISNQESTELSIEHDAFQVAELTCRVGPSPWALGWYTFSQGSLSH